MKTKHTRNSNDLYEEFSQRITRNCFSCCQSSESDHKKFERIHNYCLAHGFIFNHSTINIIQKSLSNIITSAFDDDINQKDIKLKQTHVNALPNRTEQGIFLLLELGNLHEDVRYSLVSLLGKQIPSYNILHSRGYNLDEQIRKSNGKSLLDQLAIGLKIFLDEINKTLSKSLQLGLLLHFPIKQNQLNHAEILSWSDRFNCPDLLEQDFLLLLNQSIKQYILSYEINILVCIEENIASLISVAFEYPNTLISVQFKNKFQISFVENIEISHTILSLNFQYLHSNESTKSHTLFQTLLTSIDLDLINQLNINYFDIFTCDYYLIEIIRLLIIDLCIHEKLLPDMLWIKSKLIERNSLDLKFISILLQRKYSKLKIYLNQLGLNEIKKIHLIFFEYISHIIIQRSTQILSCLIICLSNRYKKENITIAIDSYLYRSCSIYQIYMKNQIEYLCKPWITMFDFVNPTNKSYVSNYE